MRENIKSVGLILAIAIASVSLPIGIIGFNKDATINNYYNNYYTTNNNTTIINNNTSIINNNNTYTPEPEPITYPLIRNEIILEHTYQFEQFNFTYNATFNHKLYYWVIKNITNAVINDIYIYDKVIYDYGITTTPYKILTLANQLFYETLYRFDYASTWIIVFEFFADYVAESNPMNITLYHQVRYIDDNYA